MNITIGFNNASSYGVSNKQNIGFCGTQNYVEWITQGLGRTRLTDLGAPKYRLTTPRFDYNLVRRAISLLRKNPNAKVAEHFQVEGWQTIHSGLKKSALLSSDQLLASEVRVGTQFVSVTKQSPKSDFEIRLYEKVGLNRVREINYTLSPTNTSPKSMARLNALFA